MGRERKKKREREQGVEERERCVCLRACMRERGTDKIKGID